MTTFSTEVFDNDVVPASLASIGPILRVAKEIEHERPRVAYHCKNLALNVFYLRILFYFIAFVVDNLKAFIVSRIFVLSYTLTIDHYDI